MKQELTLNWLEDMAFETEMNGHKITIDAGKEVGGKDKGPRPKAFMMLALAGCTAMDVVSILQKMRVKFDDFKVGIEASLSEEHPKKFEAMKIIYSFKGADLPEDKLIKAIELSQDRYCGVSANYRDAMALTYELRVN